ncbi:MAG: hypothetical protein ABIZ81_04305 [Opitutaceae bacterium]
MSKDLPSTPHTRSWRDISQPVSARAMSGGGRRRWIMASFRVAAFTTVLTTVSWCSWQVFEILQYGPEKMPAFMKTAPVKDVQLETDGVLGLPWLTSTLALPKGVSLLKLDRLKLQERLLASGQVRVATLRWDLPDTLAITLSERSPVGRVKAAYPDGLQQELLVARDGAVFHGADFDPAMIETLPWLEGFALARKNGVFLPLVGMEAVAELLAKAKREAEERYGTWEVVSLARLASDGEIEVRTQSGTRIIFGTRDDYFRQLARLDTLLDLAEKTHPGQVMGEINLAVGPQVPVIFAAASHALQDERGGLPMIRPPARAPGISASPHLQVQLKREL